MYGWEGRCELENDAPVWSTGEELHPGKEYHPRSDLFLTRSCTRQDMSSEPIFLEAVSLTYHAVIVVHPDTLLHMQIYGGLQL